MFDKIKTAEILEDLRKPNGKTMYSFEGLSKAIEEKTGVKISHTQLMNYENNDITNKSKHIMNVDYAIAIAEFYGVSVEYLLGVVDDPTTDVKTREICKITGLSSMAIDNITKIYDPESKRGNPMALYALNELLKNKDFLLLLDAIGAHFKEAENAEKYRNLKQKPLHDLQEAMMRSYDRKNGDSVTLNPIEGYQFYNSEIKQDFIKIINGIMSDHVKAIGIDKMVE